MGRSEPPSLATWMLEHLSSGDCDEALAGDLLEEFRAGRSDRWYWRQVVTACVVSWEHSLRARFPLLVFALLWSMPAPAWKVLCDQLQDSRMLTDLWPLFKGFWILPAFAVWVVLHSIFLWAGILLFTLFQKAIGQPIRSDKIRRACGLVPVIFSPVFGVTFVLLNLYWFSIPGLAGQRLAATPFAELVDLKMLADFVRVPYFIVLLSVLWQAIPRTTRNYAEWEQESAPLESAAELETLPVAVTLDPNGVKRFFGLVVAAGLVNSMIAALVLCRLPESHAPSFTSVLFRAVTCVGTGTLAGIGGAWLYWKIPSSPFRNHPPVPFPLFALVCASGWVWVPAMMIFADQLSVAAVFVAMLAAFVLAPALRSITSSVFATTQVYPPATGQRDDDLFADSLYQAPVEAHGYLIAIALYAAGAALLTQSIYTAAALLAFSAFLFAWKRTSALSQSFEQVREIRVAALRLARLILPAVLVTAWALLDGVAHRNRIAEANAASGANSGGNSQKDANRQSIKQSTTHGLGGYESVILWPYLEKKQVVAPVLTEQSLLAPGTSRPVIIRFDGVYWYVQPPGSVPGRTAHQAHGSPLDVNIEANNSIPLVMAAHQSLSAAIRTSHCGEIQVEIENRDNITGLLSLEVLLTDGTSPQKRTLSLGQQSILSTEPDHFSFKADPAFEKLRFSIPHNAGLRKFSEITVLVVPGIQHEFVAPKIAIQQFQLFPR